MPVTSTGTDPASAGAKRSRAQTLLPIRFRPTKRTAVSTVHSTSSLVLPWEYSTFLASGAVAVLPDEQSQRALGRHEDDPHQHQSQGELIVDKRCRRGSAVRNHQVFATKK